MSPTFQTIKNAIENGKDHLGAIMWWSLSDNSISNANLIDLAKRNALPEEYLPNEIKKHGAFKRAVRHADRKRDKDHKSLLVRTILDNKDEYTVGIVEEHKEEINRDLRYQVIAKITFHKHTERIESEGSHPMIQEIEDLYIRHLDHDTNDIRIMMTNFLTESGVAIRPSGGVYFVPNAYQNTLDALVAVVESCSNGNKCFQLAISDNEHDKATLGVVAQAGIEEEIRQIQVELDNFVFEKAREKTLAKKLEGFNQLRARASMLASVLNFKVDGINEKLDKVKALVNGHVGGNTVTVAPKNNKATAPKETEQKLNKPTEVKPTIQQPVVTTIDTDEVNATKTNTIEHKQETAPGNGSAKKPAIIWTEDESQVPSEPPKPVESSNNDSKPAFNWDDIDDENNEDDDLGSFDDGAGF